MISEWCRTMHKIENHGNQLGLIVGDAHFLQHSLNDDGILGKTSRFIGR